MAIRRFKLGAFSPRQELFICPKAGGEIESVTGMTKPQLKLAQEKRLQLLIQLVAKNIS